MLAADDDDGTARMLPDVSPWLNVDDVDAGRAHPLERATSGERCISTLTLGLVECLHPLGVSSRCGTSVVVVIWCKSKSEWPAWTAVCSYERGGDSS